METLSFGPYPLNVEFIVSMSIIAAGLLAFFITYFRFYQINRKRNSKRSFKYPRRYDHNNRMG